MNNISLFGLKIYAGDDDRLIRNSLAAGHYPFVIATLNVPCIRQSHKNKDYYLALKDADCILPDGIGIVWASRFLYKNDAIKKRITGPDFFQSFCNYSHQSHLKFFFLGSTPEVLQKIRRKLNRYYPGIEVAGLISPPFARWSPAENEKIISMINESCADVLWVGMTAPKQELWVFKNRHRLKIMAVVSVGAAFDFFAGSRSRAPLWWQKVGLEWFFRVLQEPVRLGKRYGSSIPFFLIEVLKIWLKKW